MPIVLRPGRRLFFAGTDGELHPFVARRVPISEVDALPWSVPAVITAGAGAPR